MNPRRYSFRRKPEKRCIRPFLTILLLLVFAAAVWFNYKGKLEAFFKEQLLSFTESRTPKADQTGPPGISVSYGATLRRIPAVTQNQEGSVPARGQAEPFCLGLGAIINIIPDREPKSFNLTVYREDLMVFSTHLRSIKTEDLLGDGEYRCIADVVWEENNGSWAVTSYAFSLLVDLPPELDLSATEIDPGELLVLCAKNLNKDQKLEILTDFDFKPNIFELGNRRYILLPVSYYHEPGKIYQVKVILGDELYSYAVKVNEKAFATQHMTIDTKVAAATRNDKSAKEVKEKIDPLKPVSDKEAYWTDKFIMPVEGGRVNKADFGKRRYVNNSPTSYRHNGLDIGHDKGTPVMASNNGRVLLADYLIGTGNTIIIEHGFGLKTWYYHMDELSAKTGDWVSKGEVIGKVGSTGFSTGPHLHFSASVNEVFINPLTLINEGVPLIMRQ